MSVYPHSRVFVGPTQTVDIAGPHIQVLNTATGAVLHSTTTIPDSEKASVLKSGPVRCAAVDHGFKYLLTSGEDKMLKLWQLDGLQLVSERELPKKPTSVAFTADAQTILVSDKFGDIFSYPFTYVPLTVKQKKDALSSHENPSGGQLILGHASPINAFLLTPDEKYIVTADRDEHIRVSWYPKGYNIEMYCLGHLKFVSAIHIPKSDPSSLISGGGDPMLKIWDWMTGVVKHEVQVLEVVESFIAVRASKRKRGWQVQEDDGEEGHEGGKSKRRKGRGKGKQKAQAEAKEVEEPAEGDGEGEGDDGEVGEGEGDREDSAAPVPAADASENGEEPKPEPEKVLVIHRIESVDSDTGPHIVFSAVGTTALFAFPYKPGVSSSEIRHFDFGKPVIDFSVVDGKSLVVSLDGSWVEAPEPEDVIATQEDKMIRVLRITGGVLVEDSETLKTLVSALNSTSLLPATSEDLKKLDLYSNLVSMPKYASDADAADGAPSDNTTLPIGAPELSASETAKSKNKNKTAKGKGKTELSKKELGRMKGKQAVLAKAQAAQKEGVSTQAKRGVRDGSEEPEAKRARSEAEGEVEGAGLDEDVEMTGA
ncbi:hypothetical protein GALMADRAFT_276855 [Galerina marginata CBS 339.88]|uniref:Uncharacterized protein n=1 Tax=Galerina marginata (strain CBS 339.88) TaxID=685588 RepID=A0A067TBN7_GALM3|nr:hypothetical protein GALMADRAFT_276855 [Galerina marginata CBS 339.88]